MREELSRIAFIEPSAQPRFPSNGLEVFQPKSDEDYRALIRGGVQIRSRSHEKLVRTAANWLQEKGAVISNPHPIDLMISSPMKVIIEAKIVRGDTAIFAVREAVGQLHEYRYFVGPRDSHLCLLLNTAAGSNLVRYVEEELRLLICWVEADQIIAGPRTRHTLALWAA